MEGRKRITTAFLLVLACFWLLVLSNNSLAQTWQKVVPCASAAGGSNAPTYLGVTSSSYNGAQMDGWVGANTKCVAQYGAGARWMKIKDISKLNKSTPYPSNGYIDIQDDYQLYQEASVMRVAVNLLGTTGIDFTGITCHSYNSNYAGYFYVYLTTNGALLYQSCSMALPIHCVRD